MKKFAGSLDKFFKVFTLEWHDKKQFTNALAGLVLASETASAKVHDTKPFSRLLDKFQAPTGSRVLVDKAYKSASSAQLLKRRRSKNGVQYKAVRGKELTERQRAFNMRKQECM